ncbi:MAG: proline--tRNA ligase, partial [Clostridiales bacterium]|nr:proline--tRNA ligase [Clostridiales bacterium]
NSVVIVRGDTLEKFSVSMDGLADTIKELLDTIQKDMLEAARAAREEKTHTATSNEDLMDALNTKKGFIKAMWCGCPECEKKLKELTGATIRNMPFEQENISDTCALCGKPAKYMVYIARAY